MRQKNTIDGGGSDEKGAAMVEAALTITVFVAFVLFIIDIARYFFSYIILSHAAHFAADMAGKLPLEGNTTSTNCAVYAGSSCEKYQRDISKILLAAENIADWASISSDAREVGVRRAKFRNYDNNDYPNVYPGSGLHYPGVGNTKLDYDVGVLRPGERQLADFGDGETKWFEHPTRQPKADGSVRWPEPGESWGGILDKNPVQFIVLAKFDPLTPMFPELLIEAKAFALRKASGKSPGAAYPTPTATPVAITPEPTATPSVVVSSPTPVNEPDIIPERTGT